jgi:hypothetical protein
MPWCEHCKLDDGTLHAHLSEAKSHALFGTDISQLKREARRQRRDELSPARAERRERIRRERRCFWTWPFGHVYTRRDNPGEPSRCAVCGKWVPDGN